MNTSDLARVAAAVVPQVGTTGWRIADAGVNGSWTVKAILFARVDGRPVFTGSLADCRRMHALLNGDTPTSRRAPRDGRSAPTALVGLTEAPDAVDTEDRTAPRSEPRATTEVLTSGASLRICPGCDKPLPADADPQRTTHGGACRVAAFRRRADADSAGGGVTGATVIHGGHP